MNSIHLSFNELPFPTKHARPACCSWGQCGYIAFSSGNIVTIYKNDGKQFTPFLSWSPFLSNITAMGWFDGSCSPCLSRPVIAISSSQGQTIVFDLELHEVVGRLKHYDKTITCIKFSPFFPNEFYIGSNNGLFCVCELGKSVSIRRKLHFNFSVDFIEIDKFDGTSIVLGSRLGDLTVINNILDTDGIKENESKNLLTNSAVMNTKNGIKEASIEENEEEFITSIEFFPGQYEYVLLSSNKGSFIYIIKDSIKIPFISQIGIMNLFHSTVSPNNFIVLFSSFLELWCYEGDNLKKLSTLYFAKSNIMEVNQFSMLNGKLAIFTNSSWLTIIDERRGKLFVVQRARPFLPSKPIDLDIYNETIAFLTKEGEILLTDRIPKPNQMKSPSRGVNQLQLKVPFATSNNKTPTIPLSPRKRSSSLQIDMSNNADFQADLPKPSAISFSENTGENSLSSNIDEVSCSSLTNSKQRSVLPCINKNQNQMGNSNTFTISFKHNDSNNKILQHVIWITSHKLFAWGTNEGKNLLLMIDIKRKIIVPLMKKQLDTIAIPVTDVQLSADRRIGFVSFSDGKLVTFFHTRKNFETIATITLNHSAVGDFGPLGLPSFREKIKNSTSDSSSNEGEEKNDIGSYNAAFMYEGPKIVIFRINPNANVHLKLILKKTIKISRVSPTFLSWKAKEIIIGSKEGKIYRVDPEANFSMKYVDTIAGSVQSLALIDSNDQRYFVTNDHEQAFFLDQGKAQELKNQKIKLYKFASEDSMLVKFSGSGCLTATLVNKNSLNRNFIPTLPPVAFLNRPEFYIDIKRQKTSEKMIKTCIKHSHIFLANIIKIISISNEEEQSGSSSSNQFQNDWLARYCSDSGIYSKQLFKTALYTSNFDLAHHLLMKTSPKDPNYLMNMTKASFFDLPLFVQQLKNVKQEDETGERIEYFGQKMEAAIQSMIENDRLEEAVEMLLIVGQTERAVRTLIGTSHCKQAALLLMMQPKERRNPLLVKELSQKLFRNNCYILACNLLAMSGLSDETVELVSQKVEYFPKLFKRSC